MDFLKGLFGGGGAGGPGGKTALNFGICDPVGTIIDGACDAIGLPPEMKGMVKIAGAFISGNPLMGISGAFDIMQGLNKQNAPAQTEYCPPQQGEAAAQCQGYAPPPPLCEVGELENEYGPMHEVRLDKEPYASWVPNSPTLQAMKAQYTGIQGMGGLGFCDYPETLKGALLHDKDLREEFEKAFNCKVEKDAIAKPGSIVIRDVVGQKPHKSPSPPAGQSASQSASQSNQGLGFKPPKTVEQGPYFVDTKQEIHKAPKQEATQKPKKEAHCKTPPKNVEPPSCKPTQTPAQQSYQTSSAVQAILRDPNLSIEEKIQLVMNELSKGYDNQITDVLEEMSAKQAELAELKDETAGMDPAEQGKKRINAQMQSLNTSIEQLNLRMQKLMERRKSMFELQSNSSEKFNEMAKQAISNLAKA